MQLIFKPIAVWPGKVTQKRRRATFKAGYASTLKLLDRELRHLGAEAAVLQAWLSSADIRLDGWPRAGASPKSPGVILSFESRHGHLSYPCDTFLHWEDNLRAIALALEHLRMVDRYGVTARGEQYRGWTALPAPNGKLSAQEAMEVMRMLCGPVPLGTDEEIQRAYRQAALKHHPDRGGNAEDFNRLKKAKEALS